MNNYLIILGLGMCLGLVGFYLAYKFLSKKNSLSQIDYNSKEAESFLEKRGFQIIEKGRQSSVVIYVDGKGHLGSERADFIVERERKRYVVKVVNEIGIDPVESAMRRKLVEFSKLFPGLEILFLDLNAGELHEIKFKFPKSEKEILFMVFVGVFIIAVISVIVVLLIQMGLF
ncbi:hypothetical protein A2526_06545 [candidate division WOR-1 bacterium RIFOXYD2_FULL_36_8]|uniref:Uncharacterized protein n=1 Tax=candidate division WOR-1 bacterium RIFOXYB2_FULL_36_35 TaxID=1802578 RepID=A0A1F4S2P9_UNCSA|nr:MAG: hypothetical protein A2230_04465 [candidate division WOR-1 bacterium RIFOXYA2_FULL_36_21]OGC14647.1 MAG: hypothetical protein A2290_01195 [candidate division WOR-1 bacterium RIFOXYB2_FULL_36_35]OGC19665.1 MAG: hypothetical protein A2282_02920 [candidate division WOR-1 bacterium RIFOXYA12_FULL_36_13]OGC38011.1 MAG: hypothetical protein A2526_06545 [candidate division WOR-1 bacterium RIFOXYD2_FULL_36_8]